MGIQVLFICLGNICRSPMADAVFQNLVEEAGLSDEIAVDSVGTGSWHVGESAHPGTRRVLAEHGIHYNGRARQISPQDVADSGAYLIAMDQTNVHEVQSRFGSSVKVHRLLDFAQNTHERDVPDPYYSGNFEYVYQLVTDGCQGLLATIREDHGL